MTASAPSRPALTGWPGPALEPVPGLFVWKAGDGDRVVIALHGWSGSHETFLPVVPHVPKDVTLFSLDQPSFGRSAPPRDWSFEAFTAPILTAIDVLARGRPVTLLGNCGGAVVALEVALALGPRVERLVLIDPFAYVPWYFALLTRSFAGWFFYHVTFANPVGRWITNLMLSGHRARSTDMLAGFDGVTHRFTYQYLRLLCRSEDLSRYAPIEARVRMVFGRRTFKAVKKSVGLFGSLWPGSQRFELANAGHLPLIEAPEALATHAFAPSDPGEA